MEGANGVPKALLQAGEMTKSFPFLVPRRSFPCHFKGFTASWGTRQVFEISPCNARVCPAIRVGGDVAEWSKALPC